MKAFYAMPRERIEFPFRCGFRPDGKPYRRYVAHVTACSHPDCVRRANNRISFILELEARYGTIATNEHPATPPASSGPSSRGHQPQTR